MFIYMSKKIAIPKHAQVSCLAWNQQAGYIAVGGDDGMLKVLKLESGGGGNLSMNLSLEGHSGQLQVATWNEVHQKLTTSDSQGVIIVWMLYKGSWYEEMINNRNKSTVSGMAWSSDGQKICIAYEDGAVIVGSVDGSRVWGRELRGPGLAAVQWAPDNSLLLFALPTGELQLYDNQGNFALSVPVECAPLPTPVVGLDWFSGPCTPDTPCLAICYQNGRTQLMRDHNDDAPVIIDTGLQAVSCHWNHNGTVLAIAGKAVDESNAVQFFTPFGELVRTLRVPLGGLRACVWEGRSQRVAIAVDSFIYFANVKPDYKRAFFKNTLAFASTPDSVTFWDITTNQSWVHHSHSQVPCVVSLCAAGDYCVTAAPQHLIVCNQQGVQCDAKATSIPISYVCMNSKSYVIAASKDCFLMWRFATPNKPASKEQLFHPDGTPYLGEHPPSPDPIVCLACSDSVLLVGRGSGEVLAFCLPALQLERSYSLAAPPSKLHINCDSSKFSVIDSAGGLHLLDLESPPAPGLAAAPPLRRDVWGALWAADNAALLAVTEKARLYVLRDGQPEEPLTQQGYLCQFQELEIVCCQLGALGERGDPELLVRLEVKSLRDTRQLLDKVGLEEAQAFIQDNPHPKLWRLLAEAALRKLDLAMAESAYVRCGDYAGIQTVKRLAALRGTALRSAEVLACFRQFDEAEKIYLQEDRRDLAILLRQRLGHWFRVVELLKMSTTTTEAQLREAYDNIGHYYADRQNWSSAREYYTLSKNQSGLTRCYIALEDHVALANLTISSSPDKHKGLKSMESMSDQPVSLSAARQLKEAGSLLQAAHMVFKLAESETGSRLSPTRMKKLYILAGLLYKTSGDTSGAAGVCWQRAGSWHWLRLAQQAGGSEGTGGGVGALKAALRLRARRPPPPPGPAPHAALALAAATTRAFKTCSEAFVQLEALPDAEVYADLAVEIFSKHEPKDPQVNRVECGSCRAIVSDWATCCSSCAIEFEGCAVSGGSLREPSGVWRCRQCHHSGAQQEMVLRQTCPVCHTNIKH